MAVPYRRYSGRRSGAARRLVGGSHTGTATGRRPTPVNPTDAVRNGVYSGNYRESLQMPEWEPVIDTSANWRRKLLDPDKILCKNKSIRSTL